MFWKLLIWQDAKIRQMVPLSGYDYSVMLKKFFSNAALSLVMDKQAKKKYQAMKDKRDGKSESEPLDPESREAHIQSIKENMEKVITPEREELIRNAMAIQKAKSQIFDDLDDEQKKKLYALAMKALLNKDVS